MKCPLCGSTNSRVTDTRATGENEIKRRRECLACKGRFFTLETISQGTFTETPRAGRPAKQKLARPKPNKPTRWEMREIFLKLKRRAMEHEQE